MTDIHADKFIRHDDLPLHFKINCHYLSLELLTTIEIVKILEHSTQNFLKYTISYHFLRSCVKRLRKNLNIKWICTLQKLSSQI